MQPAVNSARHRREARISISPNPPGPAIRMAGARRTVKPGSPQRNDLEAVSLRASGLALGLVELLFEREERLRGFLHVDLLVTDGELDLAPARERELRLLDRE